MDQKNENNKSKFDPANTPDVWDDDLLYRYPDPSEKTDKTNSEFRNYENPARDTVKEFYRLNHTCQTYDFVLQKKENFLKFDKREMPVWDAFSFLNQLVDDSDPDTDLDQFQHLLQTSEAIRRDGHPDWMVLTGLLHDLGKVLCLFGEPQWSVVGDTFPVGCAFAKEIIYHELFVNNPDASDERYNTKYGVYSPNCGLGNVTLSWGHDEYIYQLAKNYLPEEGLYMLRYHSFYPWHKEGAYNYLLDNHDREMLKWVNLFNPYDLYSKNPTPPDLNKLKPYYEDLIVKYLPAKLKL